MKVYREFVPFCVAEKPSVFALGTFDGVHKGHQKLLQEVRTRAEKNNGCSVVLAFSNHPFSILKKDEQQLVLTSEEEKCALLEKCGVDILLLFAFTHDLRVLSAEQFVDKLFTMVPISCWVAGEDIGFGNSREGTISFLEGISKRKGFELVRVDKLTLTHSNEAISSSRIRALITEQRIADAEELLGRKF